MKNIIKIDSNLPDDFLRIELFLSNVCNYNCWYCFPGSHEGDYGWPKLRNFIDNFDHLINYYKNHLNKKQIYVHIIGGEPTLWREFGEFVKYLKETHNCTISISTNGSRTLRWWDEYGIYIDHVMISCHHERVDVAHIINVADLLYNKNITVNAMVLMDPGAWKKCLNIINQLKTSKKRWSITALEIFHDTISYTSEQKKFISNSNKRIPNLFYYFRFNKITRRNSTVYFDDGSNKTVKPNWISLNNKNNFYGWQCNVGLDTLSITKDGKLQGACGEKLYNLDFNYNIYDDNFKNNFRPAFKPTTCYSVSCLCQPEINCSKENINNKKVIPLVQI
jgi:sulfatase maturation enzyme AslB (radical SAM superfamily)